MAAGIARAAKRALILGIETSCDETAAAVVENGRRILSNVVFSQVDVHARYGGVVPEIASRHHLEIINALIDDALQEAGVTLKELDAIAVSFGPGLVGALLVGVATAKALAYAARLTLVAVNHLEAHLYANFIIGRTVTFPAVGLIASGGHTALTLVPAPGEITMLGATRDDAAGEAFDKIARALGLGYPGGAVIDRLAAQGNPARYDFPRAFLEEESKYDFSFSGLKSAVLNFLHRCEQSGEEVCLPDLAASFQEAIVEVLVEKTIKAASASRVKCVLMAGGVAANSRLREMLGHRMRQELPGVSLVYPPPALCTDNAAMIAAAAYPYYLKRQFAPLDLNAVPGLDIG